MHVDSLAFRTDLALAALAGSEVEDHGDHIAVRTPDNPTYYWGNYLLLAEAPTAETLPDWLRRPSRARSRASGTAPYGVATSDGSRDDLAAFAAAGFETDAATVMTATAVHEPPRPNREATYRPLRTDADWAQQVELWLAGDDVTSREFVVAKVAGERRMAEVGEGAWWGAFVGDRLLSSMGLVAASPGLARFQQVQTHPDARGRGLAGTLVHEVSRYGFDDLGATTLVMVADPDYLAIRIYRSVGFTDSETQLQAERRRPQTAAPGRPAGDRIAARAGRERLGRGLAAGVGVDEQRQPRVVGAVQRELAPPDRDDDRRVQSVVRREDAVLRQQRRERAPRRRPTSGS